MGMSVSHSASTGINGFATRVVHLPVPEQQVALSRQHQRKPAVFFILNVQKWPCIAWKYSISSHTIGCDVVTCLPLHNFSDSRSKQLGKWILILRRSVLELVSWASWIVHMSAAHTQASNTSQRIHKYTQLLRHSCRKTKSDVAFKDYPWFQLRHMHPKWISMEKDTAVGEIKHILIPATCARLS